MPIFIVNIRRQPRRLEATPPHKTLSSASLQAPASTNLIYKCRMCNRELVVRLVTELCDSFVAGVTISTPIMSGYGLVPARTGHASCASP